jgi:integrase/recombinase XerD
VQASVAPIVERFMARLADANYSEKTLENYETTFKEFVRYYGKRRSIAELSPADLDNFIDHMRERGFATGTVRQYTSQLKVFFRWLYSQGIVSVIPVATTQIRMTQEEREHEPTWLTANEVTKLRQTVANAIDDRPAWRRVREKLVMELLITTGARASEIAGIEVSRISMPESVIWLFGGKTAETARARGGSGYRMVPMKGMTRQYLTEWLAIRPCRNDDALFGDGFNKKSVEYVVRKVAIACSLMDEEGKVWLTPHKFRHYFATDLSEKNVPLREIAELMGDNELTVSRYYIHRTHNMQFSEAVYAD